ncbi:MAG: DUF4331 family protein [Kofleriaceae bacterium]|nr:DUF4331 family protein [Kofleriaceae bacterium]
MRTATNGMADLNDVYVWMTTDAGKVNLALTVSPFDNLSSRQFGPTVVYAFHLSSRPGFGMAGTESKIICKFASDTDGECFVVDPAGKTVDYVKGDFSTATGKAAPSGKFRVFAGKRSDPFFFNLGGFIAAVGRAVTACGGTCPPPAGTDAAKCVQIPAAVGAQLRADIGTKPATNNAATLCDDTADIDCFKSANVMAIVVEVDKTLVLDGDNKLVSVWASTHAGS